MRTFFIGTIVGMSDIGNGYMVEVFTGGEIVTYGPMHYIVDPFSQHLNPKHSYERFGGNARTSIPTGNVDGTDPRIPQNPRPYASGDKVLIANYILRDQFVILGKYVDMNPPVTELVQVDTNNDGIIDLIAVSNTEPPQ